MSGDVSTEDVPGKWDDLPEGLQTRFRGRLAGLYDSGSDEQVYSGLPRDKQEALWMLSERLVALDLWKFVGRIVNVYGQGGVGMYFAATADLKSELNRRGDFSMRFARHSDNHGGYLEKRRRRASLHFLFIDAETGDREWHVHLDLYGPMGTPLSTALHLYHERFGKFRPDWKIMKQFV